MSNNMSTLELIDLAIADLQHLRTEVAWKTDLAYGPRGQTSTGPTSGGGPNDPTSNDATNMNWLRRILHGTHRDMLWLVNKKLPNITYRLELDDDREHGSDRQAGATLTGGLSAYRGDTTVRTAPTRDVTRTDLQTALDAQHRRLNRGAAYGRG